MTRRDEVYFGPGTTPERVAEAIEKAKAARDWSRSKASVAERERFFKRLTEEYKRAGGDPR